MQDFAIALCTDGTTRVLRARCVATSPGLTSDSTLDLSATLPVFMPKITGVALPIVYDSVVLSFYASGAPTAQPRRIDSTVLDTTNGRGAATKCALPVIAPPPMDGGNEIPVDARAQFWQPGKGVVDAVGFTLVPNGVG